MYFYTYDDIQIYIYIYTHNTVYIYIYSYSVWILDTPAWGDPGGWRTQRGAGGAVCDGTHGTTRLILKCVSVLEDLDPPPPGGGPEPGGRRPPRGGDTADPHVQ